MSKFVNLEQIKVLANKVKSEDAALGTKLETVTTKVDNLVAAGGEANILEGVKVNGAALAISDKMVDILIASGEENGTISVNGAAVAIKGLAALAYKSEITEDELGEALKASIAAKATKADLDALTVRVGDIEKAGYQTAEQVQAAIAASGHAHFEVAETDPTAEGFEAQTNVMYLYMNSKTKHYDIYAKVGESVVLLDDTRSSTTITGTVIARSSTSTRQRRAPASGGSAPCMRAARPTSAVWARTGLRTTTAPTIRLASRRALRWPNPKSGIESGAVGGASPYQRNAKHRVPKSAQAPSGGSGNAPAGDGGTKPEGRTPKWQYTNRGARTRRRNSWQTHENCGRPQCASRGSFRPATST